MQTLWPKSCSPPQFFHLLRSNRKLGWNSPRNVVVTSLWLFLHTFMGQIKWSGGWIWPTSLESDLCGEEDVQQFFITTVLVLACKSVIKYTTFFFFEWAGCNRITVIWGTAVRCLPSVEQRWSSPEPKAPLALTPANCGDRLRAVTADMWEREREDEAVLFPVLMQLRCTFSHVVTCTSAALTSFRFYLDACFSLDVKDRVWHLCSCCF